MATRLIWSNSIWTEGLARRLPVGPVEGTPKGEAPPDPPKQAP